MREEIFRLEGVYFSYLGRFPALADINLRVCRGEKVAIIGANGSGKSTLLAMLDGLLFPQQGRVVALGKELSERALSEEGYSRFFRSRVGFVFQNPEVQLFSPTVEEEIAFGPLELGLPRQEVKQRLQALAEQFGISEILKRQPHQLSIGEKRRVAVASVLAIGPEVLLLDEPTSGLDPKTSQAIVEVILGFHRQGRTVITATHDMHIVGEIADTLYVLSHQKSILRQGSPEEILSDEDFLVENNLIHSHRHRHKATVHSHPHEHHFGGGH